MSWQDSLARNELHWPGEPVNTNLFKYAQQLACQGHPPDVIFLMLLPVGRAHGKTDAEIKECAANGHKYRDQLRDTPREKTPPRHRYENRPRPTTPADMPAPTPPTASDGPPAPIIPGLPALLAAAFLPGETVRIVNSAQYGEKWAPAGRGTFLTVEELAARHPEELITGAGGGYIAVNPCTGPGNADVTAHRHMLLEWDDTPIEHQWRLITTSNLPVTAVIHSGGKSLHAWVRLDAPDEATFRARARQVIAHFKERPDASTANPARMSRLPDVPRHGQYQRLLALKLGAPDFETWLAHNADPPPTPHNLVTLANTDWSRDPDNILGNRWLCRARAAFLIGQSGTGKSTLAMHAALQWCAGRDFFGVAAHTPRKILYIQAENDAGDLGEMLQGLIRAGVMDAGMFRLACQNLTLITETNSHGERFLARLRTLLAQDSYDVVIIDPLLAYTAALNNAEDAGAFLREGIGRALEAAPSRPCALLVHHTGKPAKDPKHGSHFTESDYQYDGLGSSDMVNWARAVLTLRRVKTDDDQPLFRLIAPKRGHRAGLRDYDGLHATSIFLAHHPHCQAWQLAPDPATTKSQDTDPRPHHRPRKDWSALISQLPMSRSDILRWLEGQGYSEESAKVILKRLVSTGIVKHDEQIRGIYVKP